MRWSERNQAFTDYFTDLAAPAPDANSRAEAVEIAVEAAVHTVAETVEAFAAGRSTRPCCEPHARSEPAT